MILSNQFKEAIQHCLQFLLILQAILMFQVLLIQVQINQQLYQKNTSKLSSMAIMQDLQHLLLDIVMIMFATDQFLQILIYLQIMILLIIFPKYNRLKIQGGALLDQFFRIIFSINQVTEFGILIISTTFYLQI